MQLEKTTVLSALVWTAGMLAEILFHDTFVQSVSGLILGIILAVIIIASTYFVIDGINEVIRAGLAREEEQKKQTEKLVQMLEEEMAERLRLEKEIYACVKQNNDGDGNHEPEALHEMVDAINDTTMRAARLLVKYQNKNSEEMQKKLDLLHGELETLKKR